MIEYIPLKSMPSRNVNFDNSECIDFVEYFCLELLKAVFPNFDEETSLNCSNHYSRSKLYSKNFSDNKVDEEFYYRKFIEQLPEIKEKFSYIEGVEENIDELWDYVLEMPNQIKKEKNKKEGGYTLQYKNNILVQNYGDINNVYNRPIRRDDIIFAVKIDLTKLNGYSQFFEIFNKIDNRQYVNEIKKRFNNFYIWLDAGTTAKGVRHIFNLKREEDCHYLDYPILNIQDRNIYNILFSIYETICNPKYLSFDVVNESCNADDGFYLFYKNKFKIKTVIQVNTGRIITSFPE